MEDLDVVARYAASQGFRISRKTLLVEGTTDVALFEHAASTDTAGHTLIGGGFAVIAAGARDRGGATGVLRELIALRQLSRGILDASGLPKYRFAALFDNDKAGNGAMRSATGIDTSIVENRDVFRLHPVMPRAQMADPGAIGRQLANANERYKGLKWELEDALAGPLLETFTKENVSALIRKEVAADRVHWELTDDGKARLHRFVRDHAGAEDLAGLREILIAVRSYLNVRE